MLRSLLTVAAALIAITPLTSCGDSRPSGTAGNDSSLVGGPCMENADCDDRLCQPGTRFPDGLCTISCGTSGQCPRASYCGELNTGWVCLVDCATSTDCRTGYVCEPVTEAGTNGGSSVTVCIGPGPAP